MTVFLYHISQSLKNILSGPLLLKHQELSLWIILGTTVNSIEFQKEKNYEERAEN